MRHEVRREVHKELSRRAFPRCCPSHTVRVTRQDKAGATFRALQRQRHQADPPGDRPSPASPGSRGQGAPGGAAPAETGKVTEPSSVCSPGSRRRGDRQGPEAVPASLRKEPEDLEERGAAAIAPGFLVPSLPLRYLR